MGAGAGAGTGADADAGADADTGTGADADADTDADTGAGAGTDAGAGTGTDAGTDAEAAVDAAAGAVSCGRARALDAAQITMEPARTASPHDVVAAPRAGAKRLLDASAIEAENRTAPPQLNTNLIGAEA